MQKCGIYDIKKRVIAICLVVFFALFLLLCRIFYLSVVTGKSLQAKAVDQWTRDLPLAAKRGDILDVNGEIIATTRTLYNIYLRPRNVQNIASTVQSLSKTLEISYDALYEKAIKKNVSEITVARKVDRKIIDRIIQEQMRGVYFSEDIERIYPYNDVMCQVLGFMSSDNSGQTGLENYYNKFLKGVNGSSLIDGDIIGKELNNGQQYYLPAINGLNVGLTIDIKIQQIVENIMKTALLASKPKSVSCVVMNPQSGAILAMGSAPSFDLNSPPRDDMSSLLGLSRAKMVVDVYEPGSTFKVLTAAANLEEYKKGNKNAFSPTQIYANAQSRTVDGQNIKCWDSHASGKHSNQNLQMALNNSCNPIFVDISLKLGKDTFYDYIRKFGYGQMTGIDFVGESTGLVIDKSLIKNCDLARISFGQTIAVTPLQLVCATAASINGGKYFTPHLVSKIEDGEKNIAFKQNVAPHHEVISTQTSSILASMLEEVVTKGSGKNAYIEGYRVGGKTGTAQKYENGSIAQGKNIMSFVGFFPSNKPDYICLFIVDEPQNGGFGSTIAAPYVKMIFEQIIAYKKI